MRLPITRAPTATSRTMSVLSPRSRSPDASSRTARARRITPPGARLENRAPMNAPGIGPGRPRSALAGGQGVLPHLIERPEHEPAGGDEQREPEQDLEGRVEVGVAAELADEPGAEERRGHRADAQQAHEPEVDGLLAE